MNLPSRTSPKPFTHIDVDLKTPWRSKMSFYATETTECDNIIIIVVDRVSPTNNYKLYTYLFLVLLLSIDLKIYVLE